MKKQTFFTLITTNLLNLIYPPRCIGCDRSLRSNKEYLCPRCISKLPYSYNEHGALNPASRRLQGRFPFETAFSWLYYAQKSTSQKLIHALKYQNCEQLGVYLGEQAGKAWLKVHPHIPINSLIPVPLHPKKERKRGYNQSLKICEGLKNVLPETQIFTDILYRTKNDESQTKKKGEERKKINESHFTLNQSAPFIQKDILLVDDVITTGSTIEACAKSLLAIPNVHLHIFSIAITD